MILELRVNGSDYRVEAPPGAYLLDVLRDRLGLLGTKEACAEGECGACSVLVDGLAVDSCILFAAQVEGREVITVEGLASSEGLSPVQRTFAELGAVQCGYCTPGFLVAATELLGRSPNPSVAEIRAGLAGNLCRCTGYTNIVAAVMAAGEGER
jgi:carbon-monoxide dehydrogenase small subunit